MLFLEDIDTIRTLKSCNKVTKREVQKSMKLLGYKKKICQTVIDNFIIHDVYHTYPYGYNDMLNFGLNVSLLNPQSRVMQTFYLLHDLWFEDDDCESE